MRQTKTMIWNPSRLRSRTSASHRAYAFWRSEYRRLPTNTFPQGERVSLWREPGVAQSHVVVVAPGVMPDARQD